jgi:hypothetical protein
MLTNLPIKDVVLGFFAAKMVFCLKPGLIDMVLYEFQEASPEIFSLNGSRTGLKKDLRVSM